MTRNRKGFSLVLVLTLVSALLLIAVAFADAVLSALRSSRLAWQGERALHAADAALLRALITWRHVEGVSLRVGESDSITGPSAPRLTSGVIRTRTRARGFTVEGWAVTQDGALRESRRRVWRSVQLSWPTVPVHGALTTTGTVSVESGAAVLGADATPAGWSDECSSDARSQLARAIIARSASVDSTVTISGAGAPILFPSATERAFVDSIASAAIALLSAQATHVITDSVVSLDELAAGSPACPRWFGDARRSAVAPDACTRRWPIVVAAHPGETRLHGLTPSQGVLIVRGDLRISPAVQFNGVLLVTGALRVDVDSTAIPAAIVGGVVVRDALDAGSLLRGPVLVQSSQCAVRLALAAAGVPEPVKQHGWTERH